MTDNSIKNMVSIEKKEASKQAFHRNLFGQMIIMVIGFLILLNLLMVIFVVGSNDSIFNIDAFSDPIVRSIEHAFLEKKKLEEESLLKILIPLKNDKQLMELFKSRDKQGLYQRVLPIYKELHKKYRITHLYFHTSEKKNFLRVHNFQKSNDLINRLTMKMAAETDKPYANIEFGKSGFFSMRAVSPVYENNELLGYLEIGQEIEHLFGEKFAEQDFYFLINDTFLKKMMKNNFSPGKLKKVPRTKNYYVLYGTDMEENKLRNILELSVDLSSKAGRLGVFDVQDETFALYKREFTYLDGEKIGYKIHCVNISALIARRKLYFIYFILLVVAQFSFAVIFSFFLWKKFGHKLSSLKRVMYSFAGGHLAQRYETREVHFKKAVAGYAERLEGLRVDSSSCFATIGSFAPLSGDEILCPLILDNKVASCEKCTVMKTVAPGEIDEVGSITNHMMNRFQLLIRDFAKVIKGLSSTASILSASTNSFAENTQQQAASTQEVSASIEQITSGMVQVSKGVDEQYDSLNNVAQFMDELSELVEETGIVIQTTGAETKKIQSFSHDGEATLSQMSDSMARVVKSSDEAKGIINIISDISEKINLLALNAAIESARAGEAGRGFAVVADEISKLADQTAHSINNIDRLIQINNTEINHGMSKITELINKFDVIMNGVDVINEMVAKISQLMQAQREMSITVNKEAGMVKNKSGEIKLAAGEQKEASAEIAISISTISAKTQSIAEESDKLTKTTDTIMEMVKSLERKIDFFQVD